MFHLDFNTDDFLKFAKRISDAMRETKRAISNGLNSVGDKAVKVATAYIAERLNFEPDDIADMILVRRSTPDDLSFEITSRIGQSDSSRPWAGRDDSNFEQNMLVRIVTSGDELVCPKCIAAAANGPYTMEEINNMNPYGAVDATRTEIVHPRCRCEIQNWQTIRDFPAPLAMAGGGSAPPELFTTRQLGQAIAGELEVVIKTDVR